MSLLAWLPVWLACARKLIGGNAIPWEFESNRVLQAGVRFGHVFYGGPVPVLPTDR